MLTHIWAAYPEVKIPLPWPDTCIRFLGPYSMGDYFLMPEQKLYIGNLPYRTTVCDVREHFRGYGPIHSVILIYDIVTGMPRGYGFVELESSAAEAALRDLNDTMFLGRNMRIRKAINKDAIRKNWKQFTADEDGKYYNPLSDEYVQADGVGNSYNPASEDYAQADSGGNSYNPDSEDYAHADSGDKSYNPASDDYTLADDGGKSYNPTSEDDVHPNGNSKSYNPASEDYAHNDVCNKFEDFTGRDRGFRNKCFRCVMAIACGRDQVGDFGEYGDFKHVDFKGLNIRGKYYKLQPRKYGLYHSYKFNDEQMNYLGPSNADTPTGA